VDDDDLDLDYHIRRAALPKPGTMKQLRALVARPHAIPLNHTRPLWQYYGCASSTPSDFVGTSHLLTLCS